ncbi:hypothetical protein HYU96_03670 [Candidatus Daviesbacteria bacterium]|nr:hypothetical protein [Candidatus Daviesbacteria bacterium]
MKKSIILIVFIIITIFLIPSALAVESTPSADIKAKLEELKKEIASKAAKFKEEVSQKLTNKAYAGTVANKTDNSLTVVTKSGAKIISFNQDTKLPKKISVGDFLAGLGDIDDTGVLIAKKIVLLPPPNSQPKTILRGEVVSRSGNLFTVRDKDFQNITLALPKNPPADLKINKLVIVTALPGKNKTLEARFIYVIR